MRVLVAKINDFLDADLYNQLGAFIAREEADIEPCAGERRLRAIHDGVHLGVADVWVFRVEPADGLAIPREFVIAAADWEAVVADADDFVFVADNAGADLRARVFAALGGQQGNSHEVVVPTKVICAFFHRDKLHDCEV